MAAASLPYPAHSQSLCGRNPRCRQFDSGSRHQHRQGAPWV